MRPGDQITSITVGDQTHPVIYVEADDTHTTWAVVGTWRGRLHFVTPNGANQDAVRQLARTMILEHDTAP